MISHENPGQTLQATALVHEAWLRCNREERHFNNQEHFRRAIAQAMRRILVDNARRKQARRHGGGLHRTELDTLSAVVGPPEEDLLEVDEVLDALRTRYPRQAEVAELRYFGGLTCEETANLLKVSEPTVKRDWQFARAWLKREIERRKAPSQEP